MTDALQLRDRRRITNRDKICKVCGFNVYILLHRHHITPRQNGGCNNDDNMICLCPNCHAAVHKLKEKKPIERIGHFVSILSNFYSPEQIIKLSSLCN